MKNVLIVFTLCALGMTTASAQTPTTVPSKGEVKAAAAATKTEVKAAATATKSEVKTAATATKATVKAAPAAAKTEMKKAADATKMAPAAAKAEMKMAAAAPKAEMKAAAPMTAKKKSVAKSSTMGMPKMMYKCPKGDALCDTGGKCPKCGEEMVSISGGAAKKMKAKPAETKMEPKK